MDKDYDINKKEVLFDLNKMKSRLETELRSKRLVKVNNFSKDENHSYLGEDFLETALEDILQAENSTTVKTFLPKYFNRLLRKQNKVNRFIISALKCFVNFHQKNQNEINDKINDIRRSMSNLYTRVNALVEAEKSDFTSPKKDSNENEKIDFSNFYLSFENEFRGSQEEILKRLKVHLPIVLEARKIATVTPFMAMDLGCGRGEWLSLLLDEGIDVLGIDNNQSLLNVCRSKNLPVEKGDAISKLTAQPDQSLSFISAFHLIEHLNFETQFSFIKNAFRVLRKGGVLLVETPNVSNIDVGASGFYHDPTHIRPLTSTLGKFMAEYVGFLPVKIKYLNADPSFHNEDVCSNDLDIRFHGPRDYALIAYKQ
jgi:2-polyprenyl-3-methyl-5-hydroxy-6-metoxy-1,4-benzoquinol methylase